MTFPATVLADQASGFVGDLALSGPVSASPVVISLGSAGPSDLWIGRVFSINRDSATQPWLAAPGRQSASYGMPGILVQTTEYANRNTLGEPSTSPMQLSVGDVAEILHECDGVWVLALSPADVRVGNFVIFEAASGTVDTLAPGAALPSGYEVLPGAVVVRDRASTGQGLCMISLRGPQPFGATPVPA